MRSPVGTRGGEGGISESKHCGIVKDWDDEWT
jgi:hypothetical protein